MRHRHEPKECKESDECKGGNHRLMHPSSELKRRKREKRAHVGIKCARDAKRAKGARAYRAPGGIDNGLFSG